MAWDKEGNWVPNKAAEERRREGLPSTHDRSRSGTVFDYGYNLAMARRKLKRDRSKKN